MTFGWQYWPDLKTGGKWRNNSVIIVELEQHTRKWWFIVSANNFPEAGMFPWFLCPTSSHGKHLWRGGETHMTGQTFCLLHSSQPFACVCANLESSRLSVQGAALALKPQTHSWWLQHVAFWFVEKSGQGSGNDAFACEKPFPAFSFYCFVVKMPSGSVKRPR